MTHKPNFLSGEILLEATAAALAGLVALALIARPVVDRGSCMTRAHVFALPEPAVVSQPSMDPDIQDMRLHD